MLKISAWILRVALGLSFILGARSDCSEVVDNYENTSCRLHWDCTTDGLLHSVKRVIDRANFGNFDIEQIGHTPLWLRVNSSTLYCVIHPEFNYERYRIKIYRAAHYIARLNRVLREGKLRLPNGTEWWTHYSDWVKVPSVGNFPPIFSVSGAAGFADVAGIPFMSFSDKVSALENNAFQQLEADPKVHSNWSKKKVTAFFRGSLSDCTPSVQKYDGNLNFCARAKVIYHSRNSKEPLLSDISTTTDFEKVGLKVACKSCRTPGAKGASFVRDLLTHKYVLDFDGAGNWSRRMSLLLRSGGLIMKSESAGHQFYDLLFKPGVHYIPFDPEIGRSGVGTLLQRLVWAKNNDKIAEKIARRSKSFGRACLSQSSIDYFVSLLLSKYAKRLTGYPLNYPLIDLSSCISERKTHFSLSKQCEEIIKKCWTTRKEPRDESDAQTM